MKLPDGTQVETRWAQTTGDFLTDPFLFMLVGFFALMYFTVIRPQSKRNKLHKEMLASLQEDDEIVLASGIMGKVREIREHDCLLEIARGVSIRVQKSYISSVLPQGTLDA